MIPDAGRDGRRPGWGFRILGLALVLVAFLPLRRIYGPLEAAGAFVPPEEWALGLAVFGSVAWLTVLFAGDRLVGRAARWSSALRRGGDGAWLGTGLGVAAVLLVSASWFAFHRSPHLIDSVVQLFQAEIFASGRLAAPAPPEGGFFTTLHMLVDEGGWYSQYPPGHSGLLAVGVMARAPWLVPVSLSLGSAGLMYATVARVFDRRSARLTLVLLVLCPFFWFMGASFMNHVSALFFLSLFLYLFVRWEEGGGAGALAAGAALGVAALSRPLTAVAVATPFAGFALASALRGGGEEGADAGTSAPDTAVRGGRHRTLVQGIGPVLAAGIGFAAVASLYLVYNSQVTGDPFLPGYLKLWGESHGLGFHATPWGGDHTPLTGLRNELVDLSLLNLYLFEWPVPALLPVGAAFALGWTRRRWDRRLLVAFLALPAAYFFYWHRDDFLGPRFLYSGVVFLLPLTARALLEGAERLRGKAAQLGSLFRPVDAGAWAAVFLVLCAGYAVFYGIPGRFSVYASDTPGMKVDLQHQAREAGIGRGLVFVKVSWGNRILARLRAEGVPAGLTTRSYRNVGHCDLHLLLAKARDEGWDREALAGRLEKRIARGEALVRTDRLNGDPTLRIRKGRELHRLCRSELDYDRRGYTNYSPHLVVNAPDLSGDFVVGRDLRGDNRRLRGRFPARTAVRYDGDGFETILEDSVRPEGGERAGSRRSDRRSGARSPGVTEAREARR